MVRELECDACGKLHDEGKSFYVTVVDGRRSGFLLGPYATHQEAIDNVDRGRRLANEADPRAAFYAFGTSSTHSPRKTAFGI